jgi:hypothetical protein
MDLFDIDVLIAERILNFKHIIPKATGNIVHMDYFIDEEGNAYYNFSPTTSLDDAGLVIDALKAKGFGVLITTCTINHLGVKAGIAKEGDWFCHFFKEDENGKIIASFKAYAETITLAICLAAIRTGDVVNV